MIQAIRIMLFIILSPFLIRGFAELEALINSKINEDNSKTEQVFRKNKGNEDPFFLIYAALMGLSGSILYGGGNMAIVFLSIIFSEAVVTWRQYTRKRDWDRLAIFKTVSILTVRSGQLLVIAAGFYCVSSGKLPALHMPAMLLGLIWMIFCLDDEQARCGEIGREAILYRIGVSYRTVVLYSILFIMNYGGNILSAIISVIICLLIWFLGVLVDNKQFIQKKSDKYSIVSLIILISSFVNLFMLL